MRGSNIKLEATATTITKAARSLPMARMTTQGEGKRKSRSKSKMRVFFPFGDAQGQNDR
jgi:hypothetical protein